MTTPSEFINATRARLDADIAAAEQRLADLLIKRKGLDALEDYIDTADSPKRIPPRTPLTVLDGEGRSALGATDFVFSVFTPGTSCTIDSMMTATAKAGRPMNRQQVRNALHYLRRKEMIQSPARGVWTRDAEVPAGTGTSVDNPTQMQEGGRGSNETETPPSPSEDQHHPQLGSSIAG
jgi:hypothetical protein